MSKDGNFKTIVCYIVAMLGSLLFVVAINMRARTFC